MIDSRYSPNWLPQINAPYQHVFNALKEEGIKYLIQDVNPKKLKPSQGIISLDKVSEMDVNGLKPYWISEDDYVLDGHHRHGAALSNELPKTKVIKIKLPAKDAIRVLNKIQDIYEYETTKESLQTEVVAQDVLNDQQDSDFSGFLENAVLDDPTQEILHSGLEIVDNKSNKKSMEGYRKKEIKENSESGNFFAVKPIDGYIKYDIEFENLLDTNEFGLTFSGEEAPTKKLAAIWFPNLDFKKIAQKIGADETKLINRAVSDKAKKLGFDGVKYGDIIIQGF